MTDDLRPPGTVEIECSLCHFRTWHDPLSDVAITAAAIDNYICQSCTTNPIIGFSCTACNRHTEKSHLELVTERDEHAHHCKDCIAAGIPYRSFAPVIWCWSCADHAPDPSYKCSNLATWVITRGPRDCDCAACWQLTYHSCDKHLLYMKGFFHAVDVQRLPVLVS